MPATISLDNLLPAGLTLSTSVAPALSAADWSILSNSAINGQTTPVFTTNLDTGITNGETWVFTTTFTWAGVRVLLVESLHGDPGDGTMVIQIVAGSKSTGFVAGNTALLFEGDDGKLYRVTGTWSGDDVQYSVSQAQTVTGAILPNIQHVVVLMLENRSFDNLLGWLYAPSNVPAANIPPRTPPTFDGLVEGTYSNTSTSVSSGDPVFATSGAWSWAAPDPDPGEQFDHVTRQLFDGGLSATNAGFLDDYVAQVRAAGGDADSAARIMQSYSPAQVPVISALATSFAVSDAWFASVPSQTWPNRGFASAGSSDGHVNNSTPVVGSYYVPTIFDVLEGANISWMVCNDSPLPSLFSIMFPETHLENLDHFHDMSAFRAACRQPADAPPSSKLPAYTLLEPSFGPFGTDESYHPPYDVRPAEAFLASIYGALQQCAYRDDVLFVIVFDEHGGCYDHVVPPAGAAPPAPGAVSTDETFDFSRYGVRVPAIVVSSWVTPGTVFRSDTATPFDHTSILATIRDWQGLASEFSSTLPSPRILAAPTLAPVLEATVPQAWPVISAPAFAAGAAMPDDTPLNHTQRAVLVGEARKLARVGRAAMGLSPLAASDASNGVAELVARLRTIGDAKAWLASHAGMTRLIAVHERADDVLVVRAV